MAVDADDDVDADEDVAEDAAGAGIVLSTETHDYYKKIGLTHHLCFMRFRFSSFHWARKSGTHFQRIEEKKQNLLWQSKGSDALLPLML